MEKRFNAELQLRRLRRLQLEAALWLVLPRLTAKHHKRGSWGNNYELNGTHLVCMVEDVGLLGLHLRTARAPSRLKDTHGHDLRFQPVGGGMLARTGRGFGPAVPPGLGAA